MRKLILIAACALAAAALPSLAGAGAVHGSETFTETFSMFGPDPCVDKFVTGIATQSGVATLRRPAQRRDACPRSTSAASVDLYEANGPGPWDPRPGAFVGTWTYEGHVSDQAPPSFKGAATGVTSGPFVLADGRVLRRQVSFHLTFDEEGLPAKVFFAHGVCSGGLEGWTLGSFAIAAAALATLAAAGAAWATAPGENGKLVFRRYLDERRTTGALLHREPRRQERAADHAAGKDWSGQRAGLVTRRQEDRVRALDRAARRAHLHRQRRRNRSQIGRPCTGGCAGQEAPRGRRTDGDRLRERRRRYEQIWIVGLDGTNLAG